MTSLVSRPMSPTFKCANLISLHEVIAINENCAMIMFQFIIVLRYQSTHKEWELRNKVNDPSCTCKLPVLYKILLDTNKLCRAYSRGYILAAIRLLNDLSII